jgi:RNA polymerase sigma factor (sigma-70 family)
MSTSPVVFVLDDDESVATGLTRMLRARGYTVRSTTSPVEFLDRLDPAVPGCLVADICMPSMTGLELQDALRAAGSTLPIIFVSGCADIQVAVQGMRGGAITFLTKPIRSEELVTAIEEAVFKDLAQRELQREREALLLRIMRLTPRERQVLTLLAQGMLNKQVAAALRISEKTIKVHRRRLMIKLQVRSSAQLFGLVGRLDATAKTWSGLDATNLSKAVDATCA